LGEQRKKRAATAGAGLPGSVFNAILFTCSVFFLPPIIALLPRGGRYLPSCCLGNQGTDSEQENQRRELEWVGGWDKVLVKEISITYSEKQRRHLSPMQP